jgi:hypothetical protein
MIAGNRLRRGGGVGAAFRPEEGDLAGPVVEN